MTFSVCLDSSLVPARLADVEEMRLNELSQRVEQVARAAGYSGPISVVNGRFDPQSHEVFGATAFHLKWIAIQDHWLMRSSDVPSTNDPRELRQWFAMFMGIPLRKIDDRLYEQVVLPVIGLVRSNDFETLRDCILFHELGHIIQDFPRFEAIVWRRQVAQIALRAIGLVSLAMMPIAWFACSSVFVFALFGAILSVCMAFYFFIPNPEDPPFSEKELVNNETKADRFVASVAPEKIPAYIDYFKWRIHLNQAIQKDVRTPEKTRAQYSEEGEIVGNKTHPTYANRIVDLQTLRSS